MYLCIMKGLFDIELYVFRRQFNPMFASSKVSHLVKKLEILSKTVNICATLLNLAIMFRLFVFYNIYLL